MSKKKTAENQIIKAVFAGVGVVLFWRGVWLLADVIPLVKEPVVSILLGLIILYFTHTIIRDFLGEK